MAQVLVRLKSWFASDPLSTVPVEARSDTMCTPGAVISGWYSRSPGIPRDEKSGSPAGRFWPVGSSQWIAEFVGSGLTSLHPAATPITHGATLYGFNVFWSGPSFPAANTTVIPWSCTVFDALLIGSLGSNAPLVPKELFTDRKSTRLNSSHLVISYAVFCL